MYRNYRKPTNMMVLAVEGKVGNRGRIGFGGSRISEFRAQA